MPYSAVSHFVIMYINLSVFAACCQISRVLVSHTDTRIFNQQKICEEGF